MKTKRHFEVGMKFRRDDWDPEVYLQLIKKQGNCFVGIFYPSSQYIEWSFTRKELSSLIEIKEQ